MMSGYPTPPSHLPPSSNAVIAYSAHLDSPPTPLSPAANIRFLTTALISLDLFPPFISPPTFAVPGFIHFRPISAWFDLYLRLLRVNLLLLLFLLSFASLPWKKLNDENGPSNWASSTVHPPDTPTQSLEFLACSWSLSATERVICTRNGPGIRNSQIRRRRQSSLSIWRRLSPVMSTMLRWISILVLVPKKWWYLMSIKWKHG